MRPKTIFALMFRLGVVVAVFLLPALAQAQGGCTPFQAIVQGTLPSSNPLVGEDTWGGPIVASLGGEVLFGGLSGKEEGTGHGTIGMGRGTTYKVCLGSIYGVVDCTHSFTYEANNAVWPVQPGKVGMGFYQANSAKIVQGTGRFENASGNLNVAGPFIVWPDSASPFGVFGQWNAQVTGRICGVQ